MPRVEIVFDKEPLLSTRIDMRVTDLNYGDHLGHDTLISMLHEARVRLLDSFGLQEWDAEGRALMVVDLAVSYRAEVRYPRTLEIEMAVDDPGVGSCDVLYRVLDAETRGLVALAKTRVVFVDPSSRRVEPLPKRFRELVDR